MMYPVAALSRMAARMVPPFVLRVKPLRMVVLDRTKWPSVQAGPEDLRWADEGDLHLFERLGYRTADIQDRFARGARSVIATYDEAVVGCMWFEWEEVTHGDWLVFGLSSTDVWILDLLVAPESRGRRTAAGMRRFATGEFLMTEATRLVGLVSALNRPSLRAADREKYDVHPIFYMRLLGLTLMRSPTSWRIGWWSHGRRLQLPLHEILQRAECHTSFDGATTVGTPIVTSAGVRQRSRRRAQDGTQSVAYGGHLNRVLWPLTTAGSRGL